MAKKESILELNKYVDKPISVKFTGGREGLHHSIVSKNIVTGLLKGFDTLVNLVLDECQELVRDPEDPYKVTSDTRYLGLVVCRGSSVMLIHPTDGTEEIANPFVQQE